MGVPILGPAFCVPSCLVLFSAPAIAMACTAALATSATACTFASAIFVCSAAILCICIFLLLELLKSAYLGLLLITPCCVSCSSEDPLSVGALQSPFFKADLQSSL